MARWIFLTVGLAAAVAAYMYWFRRSPDDVRDDLMSAASHARDTASDMFDRASDATGQVASGARDQVGRARDAVNV